VSYGVFKPALSFSQIAVAIAWQDLPGFLNADPARAFVQLGRRGLALCRNPMPHEETKEIIYLKYS
jgi:hypothetical protein